MTKTKGLPPKKRTLRTTPNKGKKLTGNQWQNTPIQHAFMDYWINPTSTSFGNAYESAIRAGYSSKYANQLTAPIVNNKWILEYKRKLEFTPEHIIQGIQELALNAENSRSPDDTRLKAYETLGKIHGIVDGKSKTTVINVIPILGGQSVTDTNAPAATVIDL